MLTVNFSDKMWTTLRGFDLRDVTTEQSENIGLTRIAYEGTPSQFASVAQALIEMRTTLKGSEKRSFTCAIKLIQSRLRLQVKLHPSCKL